MDVKLLLSCLEGLKQHKGANLPFTFFTHFQNGMSPESQIVRFKTFLRRADGTMLQTEEEVIARRSEPLYGLRKEMCELIIEQDLVGQPVGESWMKNNMDAKWLKVSARDNFPRFNYLVMAVIYNRSVRAPLASVLRSMHICTPSLPMRWEWLHEDQLELIWGPKAGDLPGNLLDEDRIREVVEGMEEEGMEIKAEDDSMLQVRKKARRGCLVTC